MEFTQKLPASYFRNGPVNLKCQKHGFFDINPIVHAARLHGHLKPELMRDPQYNKPLVVFDLKNRPRCPIDSCGDFLKEAK